MGAAQRGVDLRGRSRLPRDAALDRRAAARGLIDALPRSQAVRAWRYWQVTSDLLLRSVAQRRFLWPPGEPLEAVCTTGGHRPPVAACGCGIYGALDLQTLRSRGLCLAPAPVVVGRVELWGGLLRDGDELRSAYAYPARLLIVPETCQDLPPEALSEALSGYGVEVGTIPASEALGDVSAQLMAMQAASLRTGGQGSRSISR